MDFNSARISLQDLCSKPSGSKYATMLVCSADKLTAIKADLASAINYLMADSSTEVRNGGKYRDRTTPLGDIVNSAPVVSSPLTTTAIASWAAPTPSYTDYLATKAKSQRYMAYVGANDGMLHAFDGGMKADAKQDGTGGAETFAYIPASAGPHGQPAVPPKSDTADQTFRHRYYVDGPVTVSDTFNGTAWQTSLVGTTGAGGRSVFALDVTTPGSFGTGNVGKSATSTRR